jgi:serine/threonine protein kinase
MPRNAKLAAPSGSGSEIPSDVWGRLEPILERFGAAWQRGQRPTLDDYLAEAVPAERPSLLVELVHADLDYRLKAGEPARVEAYLQRYPELADDPAAVLALIAAEYELRRRAEPRVSPEEYRRRFPQYGQELLDRLGAPAPAAPARDVAPDRGTGQRPPAPETQRDPDLTGDEQASGPSQASLPGERATPALPAVPGYEILDVLGRGGMGVVYKARQVTLNRLVALKMILDSSHAGEACMARFRIEAEAVAHLRHPNIVQIYGVGESDGKPFFSLEFIEGGSLDRMLQGTPVSSWKAAQLVEILARAMHAAHRAGIIHRDLKPANVLLAPSDRGDAIALGSHGRAGRYEPKITDFGLAKRLDDDAGLTGSDAVMGTPCYMAPEQAGGRSKAVGPPTDVYALGAILYELVTGRPPFKAATRLDTLLQVLSEEPVPPSRLNSEVPRDLETICLKCLHKDMAQRYSRADDLAEDLARFRARERIRARRALSWKQVWRFCRRNPLVKGVVVAVALALIVGVVMFWDTATHPGGDSASEILVVLKDPIKSFQQGQSRSSPSATASYSVTDFMDSSNRILSALFPWGAVLLLLVLVVLVLRRYTARDRG